jgi:LCP family protein required for cell wall assembly
LRVLMESEVTSEIARPVTQQNEEIDEETALTLRSPELWENSFVVYVSGIDTYGEVNTSARSDVNILAIVNKETKTVLLISTPRDYYVPFPILGGKQDKLTHAGVFGVDSSVQTLGDYYGLPIDYYLRVNFTGFINIIDTLGGVDVDSDADFVNGGYHFQKGINHLDGRAALRFVRDRYSFGEEGDRARGRHQMAVIKGVIKGLASSKLLTNYAEIMDELSDSFQTNAPKALVGELVRMTLDTASGKWKVLTYSVNGYDRTDYAYSLGCNAYVMAPNTDTVDYARKLIIAVASGETPTQNEVNNYSVG